MFVEALQSFCLIDPVAESDGLIDKNIGAQTNCHIHTEVKKSFFIWAFNQVIRFHLIAHHL